MNKRQHSTSSARQFHAKSARLPDSRSRPTSRNPSKISFCKCGKSHPAGTSAPEARRELPNTKPPGRGNTNAKPSEREHPNKPSAWGCSKTAECARTETKPAQNSPRRPLVLPFTCASTSASFSSSSIQIDSAYACPCSECLAYNSRKKATRNSRSRTSRGVSCDGFRPGKLTRHDSASGMGESDADKPYIADRYCLKYGELKLLDVTYFAPKYGFQCLKKC